MKVVDPGHEYTVEQYDFPDGAPTQTIIFMKREGTLYPGNEGFHGGTNIQELLRVCIDRLRHLDGQVTAFANVCAISNIQGAIWFLEKRAARRHNRVFQAGAQDIEKIPTCKTCGHIGCENKDHARV